jgi:hypothetical protein
VLLAIDVTQMRKAERRFRIRDNILLGRSEEGGCSRYQRCSRNKPGDGCLEGGPQRLWRARWWYKSAIKMPR